MKKKKENFNRFHQLLRLKKNLGTTKLNNNYVNSLFICYVYAAE